MRIELYLAILVISLYLYLPEVFIPFILRRLTDRREVPSGILNLKFSRAFSTET